MELLKSWFFDEILKWQQTLNQTKNVELADNSSLRDTCLDYTIENTIKIELFENLYDTFVVFPGAMSHKRSYSKLSDI